MKLKNKGKVHPSPSSSSNRESNVLSVLNLLPATILALVSVLSLDDREVLAYMITRSLNTPTTATATATANPQKQSSSKKLPHLPTTGKNDGTHHAGPEFDCECFDCYTTYWFKWDSSPNRELIHQVIEAFEDHLTKGESFKKNPRGKRRERAGGRRVEAAGVGTICHPPEKEGEEKEKEQEQEQERPVVEVSEVLEGKVEEEEEVVPAANYTGGVVGSHHKGLARKVLPDVLGLLNSRLWGLWNPN